MRTDSNATRVDGRRLLWSIPSLLVHLVLVCIAAVVAVELIRAGRLDMLQRFDLLLAASGVLATGMLFVLGAYAWRGLSYARPLLAGLTSMFATAVCALLARLPLFAAGARALESAQMILSAIGVPLMVWGAWSAVRSSRGRD